MKSQTKLILLIASVLTGSDFLYARTFIVDKGGSGQFTTIQAAINHPLVVAGDTIRVLPGIYNEQVNVGKDIVLQGSGYENTQIVANADPAVSMSSGKMMWFAISSNTGRGVTMSGGILTNCVVWNCPTYGIYVTEGTTAIVQNCNIINNGGGPRGEGTVQAGSGTVLNTIVRNPSASQFSAFVYPTTRLLYSNVQYGGYGTGIGGITSDPQFPSAVDFKITSASPCWNTGKPDIYDPDGSRSDMGYYGGPDAPVFPVVTDMRIILNSDGTVTVRAIGKSRY